VYYALVGLPVRWFGDPADVWSYRAVAIAWSSLLIGLLIGRLRGFGSNAMLALAWATPALWFLTGVVNPNAAEVLLVMLSWIGVARLLRLADPREVPPSELWWASVPLATAIVMRPAALGAAVAMVAALAASGPGTRSLLLRWRCWAPPAVATVAVAVWQRAAGFEVSDPRAVRPSNHWVAFGRAVREVPTTIRELVSSLGWREMTAPWVAQFASWALLLGVVGWALWRGGRSVRRAIAATLLAVLLVPIVFETAFATDIGLIWQGRYSIPAAAGLVALALAAPAPSLSVRRTVAVVAAAVIAEVTTFVFVLHRYTVGIGGRGWFSAPGSWHPAAMAPGVLVAVNVVAVVAAGGLAITGCSRTRPR
jgi:hypothetical protein